MPSGVRYFQSIGDSEKVMGLYLYNIPPEINCFFSEYTLYHWNPYAVGVLRRVLGKI